MIFLMSYIRKQTLQTSGPSIDPVTRVVLGTKQEDVGNDIKKVQENSNQDQNQGTKTMSPTEKAIVFNTMFAAYATSLIYPSLKKSNSLFIKNGLGKRFYVFSGGQKIGQVLTLGKSKIISSKVGQKISTLVASKAFQGARTIAKIANLFLLVTSIVSIGVEYSSNKFDILATDEMIEMRNQLEDELDKEFDRMGIKNVAGPMNDPGFEDKLADSIIQDLKDSLELIKTQNYNKSDVHPAVNALMEVEDVTKEIYVAVLNTSTQYIKRNLSMFAKRHNYQLLEFTDTDDPDIKYALGYKKDQCLNSSREGEEFKIWKNGYCQYAIDGVKRYCNSKELNYNTDTRLCNLDQRTCEARGNTWKDNKCIYDWWAITKDLLVGRGFISLFYGKDKCKPHTELWGDRCSDVKCLGQGAKFLKKFETGDIIYTSYNYFKMDDLGCVSKYDLFTDKFLEAECINTDPNLKGKWSIETFIRKNTVAVFDVKLNGNVKQTYEKELKYDDCYSNIVFADNGTMTFSYSWFYSKDSPLVYGIIKPRQEHGEIKSYFKKDFNYVQIGTHNSEGICYKGNPGINVAPNGNVVIKGYCPNGSFDAGAHCEYPTVPAYKSGFREYTIDYAEKFWDDILDFFKSGDVDFDQAYKAARDQCNKNKSELERKYAIKDIECKWKSIGYWYADSPYYTEGDFNEASASLFRKKCPDNTYQFSDNKCSYIYDNNRKLETFQTVYYR